MTVPGSTEAAAAMSNSSAQSPLVKVISPVTAKSPLTSSLSQTETLRPRCADRLPTIMSVLKLPVSLQISARLEGAGASGKAFQDELNKIGCRPVCKSPLTSSLSQTETLRPRPADRLPTIMSVWKLPVSLEISARLEGAGASGKAFQDELNRIGFRPVSILRSSFVIRILSKALVLMARGWLSIVPKKLLDGSVPLLPPSSQGIVSIPSLTEFRFARHRLRQVG